MTQLRGSYLRKVSKKSTVKFPQPLKQALWTPDHPMRRQGFRIKEYPSNSPSNLRDFLDDEHRAVTLELRPKVSNGAPFNYFPVKMGANNDVGIPWELRALFPFDAVDYLCYDDHIILNPPGHPIPGSPNNVYSNKRVSNGRFRIPPKEICRFAWSCYWFVTGFLPEELTGPFYTLTPGKHTQTKKGESHQYLNHGMLLSLNRNWPGGTPEDKKALFLGRGDHIEMRIL